MAMFGGFVAGEGEGVGGVFQDGLEDGVVAGFVAVVMVEMAGAAFALHEGQRYG